MSIYVGMRLRFEADDSHGEFEAGKLYKIERIDNDGNPVVINDYGGVHYLGENWANSFYLMPEFDYNELQDGDTITFTRDFGTLDRNKSYKVIRFGNSTPYVKNEKGKNCLLSYGMGIQLLSTKSPDKLSDEVVKVVVKLHKKFYDHLIQLGVSEDIAQQAADEIIVNKLEEGMKK